MNRFLRWLLKDMTYRFTDEDGAIGAEAIECNKRYSDKVTDELVKKVANNGDTTKELVARNYLENKLDHADMKTEQKVQATKLSNHDKIIWSIFVVIFLALVTGAISLIYWFPKFLLENLIGG